jgi:hypothetical protein
MKDAGKCVELLRLHAFYSYKEVKKYLVRYFRQQGLIASGIPEVSTDTLKGIPSDFKHNNTYVKFLKEEKKKGSPNYYHYFTEAIESSLSDDDDFMPSSKTSMTKPKPKPMIRPLTISVTPATTHSSLLLTDDMFVTLVDPVLTKLRNSQDKYQNLPSGAVFAVYSKQHPSLVIIDHTKIMVSEWIKELDKIDFFPYVPHKLTFELISLLLSASPTSAEVDISQRIQPDTVKGDNLTIYATNTDKVQRVFSDYSLLHPYQRYDHQRKLFGFTYAGDFIMHCGVFAHSSVIPEMIAQTNDVRGIK